MSLQDDREYQRRRKSDPDDQPHSEASPHRKKRRPAGEVGRALQSAYQRMVDEDIPPEMLDLLGKLG